MTINVELVNVSSKHIPLQEIRPLVVDGRAASGSIAAPGVYFVRLETADRVVTKRVVRLAH